MRAAAALLLSLLAACSGGEPGNSPGPELRGEAFFLERIGIADGATLQVALMDLNLSDPGRAIVAETSLTVGNPPYPFALGYESAALQPGREYGLMVWLRDSEGRLLFSSLAGDPVPLQQDSAYRIRLYQTPGGSEVDPLSGPAGRTYQCGDIRVTARAVSGALRLTLPGGDLVLPAAVSAAGARFSDGRNEFWSQGAEEARLRLDGGEPMACAATEVTNPWEDARSRGVAFRAVGNEPGWYVEVDRGEAPSMRLVLDYGERQFTFAVTTALSAPEGFRGENEGTVAELRILREQCADGMSGAEFPARAELTVNGQVYRGCGRYLME